MAARLNLWGKATQEDRTISGVFGSFVVTLRRPTAAERVRMMGLFFESNIQELLLARFALLVGWKELYDVNGNPIPFNDHNKEAVFGSEQSILDATLTAIADFVEEPPLGEAKEKNSEMPRGDMSPAAAAPIQPPYSITGSPPLGAYLNPLAGQ